MENNFALFIFGLLLLIYGVLSFVARDALWALTELSNQLRGVASERGELWELRTTVVGAISLVVGLIMLINGL